MEKNPGAEGIGQIYISFIKKNILINFYSEYSSFCKDCKYFLLNLLKVNENTD